MVFSTIFFLTVFFPLFFLTAWTLGALSERTGRLPTNLFILLASLGFYFWGEGLGVCWLAGSVVFNFLAARIMVSRASDAWRKTVLGLALAANLAFLGVFKYAGFAVSSLNLLPGISLPVPEIALPLGISFYTFQAMSYVVDVYRGDVAPSRNIIDFGCYVTMFPQLVAGPIVRYRDIAERMPRRSVGMERTASGFRRFLCGLAKKVLVANTVGSTADAVWRLLADGHAPPPSMAWAGALAYTLQIYYDFSGYSDMAIGMGRMLGFDFPENFEHPYCSRSVREFWRRWHLSLSTWFRDYLYIPLGGNRRGLARTCLNSMAVFALCGLWHGAGGMFLCWGLWHGMFLMIERLVRGGKTSTAASSGRAADGRATASRLSRAVLGHLYTAAVVVFGWILFRSENFAETGLMLRSMAGLAEPSAESGALWLELSPLFMTAAGAGLLFAYPVVPCLRMFLARHVGGNVLYAAENVALSALGLASILFVAGSTYNPFLYFRF